MRNWKGLKLFRPSKEEVCEHINELFSGEIDWELIQNLYPDMMRVAYVCS
ncbi:Tn3 family transposase [Bacillus tropicus]